MNLTKIGPNQYEMRAPRVTVLFSYSTPVAARIGNEYFKTNEYFSVTTKRHVNNWLKGILVEEKPQSFFEGLVSA